MGYLTNFKVNHQVALMDMYFVTLTGTLGMELAIVSLIRLFASSLRAKPTVKTCLCINLVSHPLATLFVIWMPELFFVTELGVLVLEVLGYRYVGGISIRWSITLAVLTNFFSMVAGLVFLSM